MSAYDFLTAAGLCFISWCISRLLLNLQIMLEEKKPDSIPAKILIVPIALFLIFGGFIISGVLYVLQAYPNRRVADGIRQEERERYEKYLATETRVAAQEERRRASAEYKELVELRIQSAIQKDREARNEHPPSE